jgi:phosphatidylserine/phosphatidylglycerophosphate/cardiolipin synthase-like enzyme/uncharacterized membrane protein YdjX (TVP38/TMEM64 family)
MTAMKLEQGKNCWRISQAKNARLLIDGAAYFSQFRKAVIAAKYRVLITAWDIDSHVKLVRPTENDGYPEELGDFLLAVLRKNKQLHIYILLWDFSMIYAFERDWTPVFNYTDWRKHPRLHLILDGNHSPGASHHQKIVTVDQSVAFVGGFDLSKWRWDTEQHHSDNKLRIDPDGKPYPPFHDVQFMVSGHVVKDLNDLFSQRWKAATGRSMPEPFHPIPEQYEWLPVDFTDFQDIPIAIARTYCNSIVVKEIEHCHIEAIQSAKKLIYIENQYLTSSVIGNELIKRLKSDLGPEIVIILPRKTGGWLEQMTMDVLRERLLYLLELADKHDRLRVYYPEIPTSKDQVISVHSKLFIVDDTIIKAGSSNLSNRSMSLDSECDLIISANSNYHISSKIALIRFQLLSEHLGISREKYAEIEEKKGAMIQAIEELNKENGRLVPLKHNIDKEQVKNIAKITIVDPEQAVEPHKLIEYFIGKTSRKNRRKSIQKFLAILSALIVIALLWSLTPLGDWIENGLFTDWFKSAEIPLLSPFVYGLIFTVSATIGIPVTVIIGGIGIIFGPIYGSFLAMFVCIISAGLSYLVGRFTGKNFIRSFAGDKVNSISKRLAKKGILTMIFLRIVPVAPYAVINLLAGASHIRFRDYTIGTAIGMIPGILIITTFFGQLVQVFKQSKTEDIMIMIGLLIIIFFVIFSGIKYIYQKKSG